MPESRSCATELVCRGCGWRAPLERDAFRCPGCDAALDVGYDYERARSRLAERGPGARPASLWRYEELLPIRSPRARALVGRESGSTPLRHARRLGAELGLRRLYLKDDSTNRPTLSYKDRAVAVAVARAVELGRDAIGCVSTGNVGTATAALAAQAGISPFVFYPAGLERAKARACRALGAEVVEVEGAYDEANRACRELAEATGTPFANITLRPFYGEGAKTLAYEVVEQLGWRAPEHIVMPAAGGTLCSRVHKGLRELALVGLGRTEETRLHVAQPAGCSPIAAAIAEGAEEIVPQAPETLARSLAIGAPGDGRLVLEAVRGRGGSAAAIPDGQIIDAMELLARSEGILAEPAGGATVAATAELAQRGVLGPEEVVVAAITGNGLKTLSEQPVRPWAQGVACEPAAMAEALTQARSEGVRAGVKLAAPPARRRRRCSRPRTTRPS